MELVLPYLESEGFKQGLLHDYRFRHQDFLNSTFMEMPDDLGTGKLILSAKKTSISSVENGILEKKPFSIRHIKLVKMI
jgi:hypothetical protein